MKSKKPTLEGWSCTWKSTTLPTYALSSAVCGSTCLGLLFGWILFGRPHLINEIFVAGNAAEWVAAVGTWAIGFGALKWARIAHEHSKAESEERRLAARRRQISKLTEIRFRISKLKAAIDMLATFVEEPEEKQTQRNLRSLLDTCMNTIDLVVWTDTDKEAFTPELTELFATFFGDLQGVTRANDILLRALVMEPIALTVVQTNVLNMSTRRAHTASDSLAQFEAAIIDELTS